MADGAYDPLYENELVAEPEEDEPWAADGMAELPPRAPRRKLVTPVRAALLALLLAAAGFIGGVEVQKGQGSSGTAAARASAPTAAGATGRRFGGFAGGGGFTGAAGNSTVGSVKSKNGPWLYVQDSDGTTVKVRTTTNSKVTRTAKASVSAIHPGDRVVVQGTTSASGTVTATQIIATSATASSRFGG
jgi:hypothetical protein